MKVYLLILNFCMDGMEDTSVEVYATKQAAQERMRSEYQEFHNNYAEEYPDEELDEECNDMDAYICMKNTCLEGYDRWRIVEEEVLGVEDFTLVTVCRADLEHKGYDITNVDDDTMQRLASKMGNAYLDDGFWIDIEICADSLCIPRKEE